MIRRLIAECLFWGTGAALVLAATLIFQHLRWL
jgi:hypothetical protein